MSYVVTALFDGADTGHNADTAVTALEMSVAILRREDWPHIANDRRRKVSLADLLNAAVTEATEPAARRRLTGTLADYLESQRDVSRRTASESYVDLHSGEHEAELRNLEALGQPTSEVRQRDAEESDRIFPILFAQGAWRDAGRSWASLFGVRVPDPVVYELITRRPSDFDPTELRDGVQEGLTRRAESRRNERAGWAERASGSRPQPNGGADVGRPRGAGR
jgi:hypothetical protein